MISNYKFLLLTALITSTSIYSQTGPGGVGDNTSNIFWLDANEIPTGTYSDGDDLDTWLDVSGNGQDLTQPTANLTPEYKTGILNGYPVVRFNKTVGTFGRLRRNPVSASFPSTAITTFIVNQNGGETNDALFSYAAGGSGQNDYLLFQSNNITTYRSNLNVASGVSANDGNWHIIDANWRSSDGDTRIWLDGTQRFSTTFSTGTTINAGGCLALAGEQDAIDGNYEAAQAHLGDYAEVLVYNISLNQAQRIIVANYLAAKYNIAMAGNDYFSYESTHSIDVAGIGQELGGTQTHTAAMSDGILQVENPSGLNDQEYLIFGHDAADITTTWTATETPAGGSIQRLAREWRFSETNGDVGTVDFLIDIATFPAIPVGFTKYALMVDSDGDFSTGADVYEIGLVAGTEYDLTGINIADGDFVALAVIDPEIEFTSDKSNGFEPINAVINIELNYIPRTDVTVDYTTADGSALVAQPDYTAAAALTTTILAGSNTGTITIPINDDAVVEPDETLTITLSNPIAGVALGAETMHTYTINDDDNARKIYFDLATNSGAESVSPATVTISMSSISASDVTVDYAVTGGTATSGAGNDFVLASGTVTIIGGSGSSTGSFNISVNNDLIYELGETIIIELSNPQGCNLDLPPAGNVGTGFTEHTYTIIDNDTPPEIQFTSATGSGIESVTPGTIAVSTNIITEANASATYTVANVTATNGSDYTLANGTVSISAGSTATSILSTIIDDGIEEISETFTITLSAPINATLGTNTVFTYTIIDNDQFGYLGPGGIGDDSNNKLWVRADAEIYSDAGTTLAATGGAAQEWHDQSGNSHDMSQPNATFRPNYIENVLNTKPVMRFNVLNNRIRRLNFTEFPSTAITTISVANTTNSGEAHVSYATTGDNNNYLLFNSANQTTYIAGSNVASGQSFNDGNWHILGHTWKSSGGENRLYKDGTQVYSGTLSNGGAITTGGCLAIAGEQDIVDGNYQNTQDYQGDIAETIIYNTKLNTAQRIIVNNYLAAKYGLTIANDFFVHQAIYGNEVAGIGRFDVNNYHLDAQGTALVRINNASSLDDGDFLIWGHNDVDTRTGAYEAPWIGELPVGVNNSVHRLWRVDETGDVGTVNVKFDISSLVIGATNDLVLLIDSDDGDFANATVIPISSFSAPYANFDGIDFSDGNWFTLGTTTTFNSLPIELVSFKAQLNNSIVDLAWQTASELNNDFFSVQKSIDGQEWETIAVMNGAGNSTALLDYSTVDTNPVFGTSFYRLKQTDFDGTFTFSKVETIAIEDTYNNDVLIYPNPTSDIITIVADENELKQVIVLNSLGQDVTIMTEVQNQNDTSTQIDLSGLSKGVYFIKTKTSATKVYKQ